MKYLFFSFFAMIFLSCKITRRISLINYKIDYNNEKPHKIETYSMNIPRGYKLEFVIGESSEIEQQYTYKDSSKMYITNSGGSSFTYNYIKKLGDTVASKRFESLDLKKHLMKELGEVYIVDTMILQGKTSDKLYWKDIRIDNISIGYADVPETRKAEFDKALNTFLRCR
jgi:hypothetical protein